MEQYFGVRWVWMSAGCAILVAACGLSTAGEEVATGKGGDSVATDDGGGGQGSDEGGFNLLEDGGVYLSDGGSPGTADSASGTCDLTGTWGSLMKIGVSWAPQGLNLQTFILAPGSGTIKQWIKGVRVQHGSSLMDTTVVCGIDLPDFQGTQVVAGQTYGVVFPDSLFDDAVLPTFQVDATVTSSLAGASYSASATAALLGLTMTNPTTDAWPATVTTATDPDKDGRPGVTLSVAQGPVPSGDAGSYAYIPVGIPGLFQPVVVADKVYVAIRQVTEVTGTVLDCDHISGSVSIPQIAGQYAINSHVVGCEIAGGGDCTTSGPSSQASFVDNTQPVFTPSGTATFASLRLPPGATCRTVRGLLP